MGEELYSFPLNFRSILAHRALKPAGTHMAPLMSLRVSYVKTSSKLDLESLELSFKLESNIRTELRSLRLLQKV